MQQIYVFNAATLTFAEVRTDADLPLDEVLPGVEGKQDHSRSAAHDRHDMGLAVQRKPRLDAVELFQPDGRLRLAILEAILRVFVQ